MRPALQFAVPNKACTVVATPRGRAACAAEIANRLALGSTTYSEPMLTPCLAGPGGAPGATQVLQEQRNLCGRVVPVPPLLLFTRPARACPSVVGVKAPLPLRGSSLLPSMPPPPRGGGWCSSRSQVPSNVIKSAHATARLGRSLGP
jgi:hypothetical protein